LKNLFELKNARRVLVDGNTFDSWWPQGHVFAIVLTVRNQNGTNPWAIVEDVTFTNNRLRNILGSGINFLAHDSPSQSQRMQNVLVANNLFETLHADGFQVLAGPDNLQIRHNTVMMTDGTGSLLKLDGSPTAQGFVFADNIIGAGKYMVDGNNVRVGDPALATYAPGAIFTSNVIYGPYPTPGGADSSFLAGNSGNYFPANRDAVGFEDLANGNYSLAASSRYKGKATDGTDPGVDWGKLTQ